MTAALNFPTDLRPGSREYIKASQVYNEQWLRLAHSSGGSYKVSGIHQDQLEDYLHETCVLDKIMPPDDVKPEDCEIGIDNDTLFYRLWFQPETRAYLGSFEATPTQVQELFVPRLYMTFMLLSSPCYVINDYNLGAYPFPLGQQAEDSIGIDLQEAKDWAMLQKLEETLQASRAEHANVLRGEEAANDIALNGAAGNGLANTTPFRGRFQRGDMSTLKEYYTEARSTLDQMIIPEKNYVEIERWDVADFGDQMMGEVTQYGYKYDTVNGVKMIRTIKTDSKRGDVFRTGNLYGFASPEEIGRNKTLRGLKFYFDRDHQFMSMDAQFAFGFVWAVSARVCKLELYNGGLRIDNSTIATEFNGTTPGSDELWGDPESVTEKDYYNIDEQYHRPVVYFS